MKENANQKLDKWLAQMELPTYEREYCCVCCGLVWFAETQIVSEIVCPECGNNNTHGLMYACDSSAYAYLHGSIVAVLKEEGKEIHYHPSHPYHPDNVKARAEKESHSMSLEEAIEHALEVAESGCDECSRQHYQLAKWLQELKLYREGGIK